MASPPAVLARVVRIAGDPSRPIHELGAVCAQDPGLTVELLRAANRGRVEGWDPVRNVPKAVIILGAKAVRSLVITHTMRVTVGRLPTPGFDTRLFWEDSLRRGAATALLAEQVGWDDVHEAFAVGLTMDLGTLLLAARLRPAAEHLGRLRSRPGRTRVEAERVLGGRSHPEELAATGLIDPLSHDHRFAVLHHHAPPEGETRAHRLARLAWAADRLADVVQAFPKNRCIADAEEALRVLGIQASLANLIDTLAERVVLLGQELELEVEEQPRMEAVEAEVAPPADLLPGAEIVRVSLGAPPRRDELRDPLTGLGDRRAFRRHLVELCGGSGPLTLLLADLDHFKRINDAWGTDAGNVVLCEVAAIIEAVAGSQSRLCRIGGEEFALLLPGLDNERGRRLAEQLRRDIAATPIIRGEDTVHMTISIGAATTFTPADPDALLDRADRALHKAKQAGRDRVVWEDDVPAPAEDLPLVAIGAA